VRDVRDERGAVIVMVAISISVLLGIAALVVDHGHNLSEYRRLTTGTDAAALAAAASYGAGNDGCQTTAADYLARNAAEAAMTDCLVFGDSVGGTFGWVIVDADLDVEQYFAKTLGHDIVTVHNKSAAVFGIPTTTYSHVRPMGLCLASLENNAIYAAWQAGPQDQESLPVRVLYNKEHPDSCGTTTGNWGFADFDGGGNSNIDTVDWIENGYLGPVGVGYYDGDPGAISGSHKQALQSLVDRQLVFWLPGFETSSGLGANVSYYVSDFLPVRLVDFKTNGNESKRYLEFVIVPNTLLPVEACCAPVGSPDNGLRHTALVALDENGMPLGVSS